MTSSPSARFRDAAASRRRRCGSMRSGASFPRCGRAPGIAVSPIRAQAHRLYRLRAEDRAHSSGDRRGTREASLRPHSRPEGLGAPLRRMDEADRSQDRRASASPRRARSVHRMRLPFDRQMRACQSSPIEPGVADPGRGTGSAERKAGRTRDSARDIRGSLSASALSGFSFERKGSAPWLCRQFSSSATPD